IATVPTPKPAHGALREAQEIVVDGKREQWRLEWEGETEYDCFEWSCPCENVTYGEHGELRVVVAREGQEERSVSLGNQALQRWVAFEDDADRVRGVTEESIALLEKRPVTRIMFFGDYDHDGRAEEFVLDRGSSPCSMHDAILIGLDRKSGAPHVVGTVDAPDKPLSLN